MNTSRNTGHDRGASTMDEYLVAAPAHAPWTSVENVKQWSEMPIRQVAANSETIILASVDSGSSHTNGLFTWKSGAFYLSRLASSPWVTAADATRFVDQQPGQEEMAASGGGFSKMFDASPHERLW